MPGLQAVFLGLLTFIQEDVPTVTAALWTASGRLAWPYGYLGCFAGIWFGDALLYLVARGWGRRLLDARWARRWVNADQVKRSERWFAEKGDRLLWTSRFVPGTRLPTYLAAGILRLPMTRFLWITGVAVALWTSLLFALTFWFGPKVLQVLNRWTSHAGKWAIAFLVSFWVVSALWKRRQVIREQRWFISMQKLSRWEFWPAWAFYFPVVLRCLALAIRYRGLTVPTASNPGMASGGMVGESKFETLQDLMSTSPEFTAQSWLIPSGATEERLRRIQECVREHQIAFPLILKPDVGQRGVGVKKIQCDEEVMVYLKASSAPLILQRYVPGPKEVGIFFYRLPNQSMGRIFAITEKVFPELVGDGVHTLEELIWADPRARFMARTYLERHREHETQVLSAGERFRLVEAGNHAQGCEFRDGARLWSEALERQIDSISGKLNGFYIGRYDLRYRSEAELREGRGFQILELNGAAAEATSLYDAKNTLWSAYRMLFQQWELVFRIGAMNRRRGHSVSSLRDVWQAWRQTQGLIQTYPKAD